MSAAQLPAYLLVETAQSGVVAVRFPSWRAARDWEDEHDTEITAVGCVQTVTAAEALKMAANR